MKYSHVLLLSFLLAAVGAMAQAVRGSGTANTVPVWLNANTVGNSILFQNNGNVGIGTTSPAQKLDVAGNINSSGTGTFAQVTTSGNINLPSTSGPTVGVLTSGGNPFLYNFGADDIFLGTNTGNFSMSGNGNLGLGSFVLNVNTTGSLNIALGRGAMLSNTTGEGNVVMGYVALAKNTAGLGNVAVGTTALGSNTTGNTNTAVGYVAGWGNRSGNLDANVTGSNNTFIGADAGPGTSNEINNATAIGANAGVSASNSMVLGDGTINVGIGTQTPTTTLQVTGGDISTTNQGAGLIVNSPDGTRCARIGIDNTGAITATPVACP